MHRYLENDSLKLFFFVLFSALATVSTSAQTASPEGRWKTIDEDTGAEQSIIEIYADGDAYRGKVASILTGDDDALCTKCDGDQKNEPIIGLVVIENLKADGDETASWNGGTILDPQSGNTYKLSAWYEQGNPDVLFIRGKHWTGLYRTQRWIRE
jgi:uncharacterized protein (DUF2147 family)